MTLMKPSCTPGTATKMVGVLLGCPISVSPAVCSGIEVKEQKFSELTVTICSNQGCFLSDVASSIGNIVEKSDSSSGRNCQTLSL